MVYSSELPPNGPTGSSPADAARGPETMGNVSEERARWLEGQILPHEPALRAWLTRQVSYMEVDDVVQEAYAALAGLASVAHIQNPEAYLFRVARSIILQHLRRAPVVSIDAITDIEGLEIPDPSPSPERQAGDRQELHRIAALIAGLPARCREAFVLRKVHGVSQRDIATRMGISENTVEKQVGKALRLLMEVVGYDGKARPAASKEKASRRSSTDESYPNEQNR